MLLFSSRSVKLLPEPPDVTLRAVSDRRIDENIFYCKCWDLFDGKYLTHAEENALRRVAEELERLKKN